MKAYVLDASLVAAWLLPNQSTAVSKKLFDEAPRTDLRAPTFFAYEMHRLALKAEIGGWFAGAEVEQWLVMFWGLPIHLAAHPTPPEFSRVRDLARSTRTSFYDALYLDLAMRLELPIVSADIPLIDAATELGLEAVNCRSVQ